MTLFIMFVFYDIWYVTEPKFITDLTAKVCTSLVKVQKTKLVLFLL